MTLLHKYNLVSSANVAIVKKSLLDKDLISLEKKEAYLSDPVMGIWLKRQ